MKLITLEDKQDKKIAKQLAKKFSDENFIIVLASRLVETGSLEAALNKCDINILSWELACREDETLFPKLQKEVERQLKHRTKLNALLSYNKALNILLEQMQRGDGEGLKAAKTVLRELSQIMSLDLDEGGIEEDADKIMKDLLKEREKKIKKRN